MSHPNDRIVRLEGRSIDVRIRGRLLLSDVSIAVGHGEVVGLLGENGAGKSTLLRCLSGLRHPTRGSIELDGSDLARLSASRRARKLAVLSQDLPAELPLRVRDVVALGQIPHRSLFVRERPGDAAAVAEGLALVRASAFADRPFSDLSGGERQRVMLARALIQTREILLLDEPTNHLDVRHQLQILGLIKRLGVTAVAALHDMNLAAAFCDRLVVLKEGRVIAAGRPETVLTPALIRRAFEVAAAVDPHPGHGRPRVSFYDPTHDHVGVAS